MALTVDTVWRDYATGGVPSSGPHQPVKHEIRDLLRPMEAAITAFLANGGLVYTTRALLLGNTTAPVNQMAWVILDPAVANNGIYQKQTVGWLRVADLPYDFILATDSGAGTANAISTTSLLPISIGVLVAVTLFETTTATPVTVAFNGGAALTIKTATGNDPAPGGLTAGMALLGLHQGTIFRLLSDQASMAIQAAAEAAQGGAEDARDLAIAAADQAAVEGAGDVPMMPSRALAVASTIPVERTYLQLAGYTNPGDGGAALYKKVVSEPTHAGKFQSVDGAWWELCGSIVNVRQLGAKGDGVTNDAPAIQNAVNIGRPTYIPAGNYVITAEILHATTALFAPGMHVFGDGRGRTIINNQVANGAAFASEGGTLGFQLGGSIRDLTIMTTTSPVNSSGVRIKATWMYELSNLHIYDLSADAIKIVSLLGDLDAANTVRISNCRLQDCAKGINLDLAPGVTQVSLICVERVFFQSCGVGYRFIGLAAEMRNCAFTENDIALLIFDNGSANAVFTAINNVFENNYAHVVVQNLNNSEFIGTEFANGLFTATAAFDLTKTLNCRFVNSRARIGPGVTPYTFWKLNTQCFGNSLIDTFYHTYDAAGQVRYSIASGSIGNRISDNGTGRQVLSSVGTSITVVSGTNNDVALPVSGEVFTCGAPAGAFTITGLANGWDGRRIYLYNQSGQSGQFNYEDAGSTAANRFRMKGTTNVTVPNQGSISLIYIGFQSRWVVIGTG